MQLWGGMVKVKVLWRISLPAKTVILLLLVKYGIRGKT